MTFSSVFMAYVVVAASAGLIGTGVACDGHRSMRVRACATWVAMTCFVWPVTAAALAAIAVSALRRHRHGLVPVAGAVMHATATRQSV
ncbi:hypothetical protein [Phycicoccus duodecadis]|uniref:Uncharacterized protein n=1 Tax=Phycicoccus duodecadis TaxID=173053 RepID=A0A2N3YGR3_9MICO|nr:hypothetical protein [Phycicoccus duodecadis]PKW26029.1 hypothetical protein ATL31_0833 [Phycicoccus duodecadis]